MLPNLLSISRIHFYFRFQQLRYFALCKSNIVVLIYFLINFFLILSPSNTSDVMNKLQFPPSTDAIVFCFNMSLFVTTLSLTYHLFSPRFSATLISNISEFWWNVIDIKHWLCSSVHGWHMTGWVFLLFSTFIFGSSNQVWFGDLV